MATIYDELFQAYVAALREVKAEVETWWRSLLDRTAARLEDPLRAETVVRKRWPLGPVAHPRVIAVYRDFYFRCEAVSTARRKIADPEDDEVVPPELFLTEWLLDEDHEDLAEFLGGLPFAPIGMSHEGSFV